MKRTYAIATLLLSLGCVFAAHRTSAQTPSGGSSIGDARKQYDEAELSARSLVSSILDGDLETPVADKAALREKLRPLVEESFKARQQLQQAELEELRRRLGEIERTIEEREKHKEAIVNSRIDALLAAPTATLRNQPAGENAAPNNKPARIFNQRAYDEWTNPRSIPNQISPGSPEAALPKLPPGMEARVRNIQENVEVNGVTTTITRPVIEYVQIERPKGGQSEDVAMEPYAPASRKADGNSFGEAKNPGSLENAADLDTRERLALLDLQPAQDKVDDAEKALSHSRKLQDKGYASELEVSSREKDLRHAAIELRRAKVRLEGLAAQRIELQTAAESALAETEAEVERATAKVKVAEANVAAAEAKKAQLDADVDGAKSNRAFQAKRFDRLKSLAREKAIDSTLVDEAEEKLHAAEAALSSAQAVAAHGGADIDQAKAALIEVRAELNIAEARRRAAQARRDRLTRQTPQSEADPLKPSAGSSETGSS